MTNSPSAKIRVHEDPDLFREAIRFTAAEASFPARLIEKDYFCTVLLVHLAQADEQLVFKGGTCLAKVHGDFYRMSEDLDFAIPMAVTASRLERSSRISRAKKAVNELSKKLPCFQVAQPLRGANQSTQYIGSVRYLSIANRQEETVTLEISLREPLHRPVAQRPVRTMLLDPVSGQPLVSPRKVQCVNDMEAWAEKCRAAMTRRDVAIRDFYDVDYAVRMLGLRLDTAELIEMLKHKLAVPGNDVIDVGPDRLARLQGQVDTRLKPVLRAADLNAFDVDRAFRMILELAQRLAD